MSELSLEETNKALNNRILESKKKEDCNERQLIQLSLRLSHAEKDNSTRKEASERIRHDLQAKLETVRAHLKKKDLAYRNLDAKCMSLIRNVTQLTSKSNQQKTEVEQLKNKVQAVEKAHGTTTQTLEGSKQCVAELTKELASSRQANDVLQKSLLTEKKMSRFFIKERDQLLEEQEARFKEADKELVKLKQSVGSLTGALKQKIAECKTQREATKAVMLNYQKKGVELKVKMQELEKKQEELANKQCEYCGF